MIGRQNELGVLNDLYHSGRFEYLVMYGRRRVGKTTLLQEFAKGKEAVFFPAREKNDALNLHDFSQLVQIKYDGAFIASFEGWKDAF
ncbi:MAG: ATP-binding protein, partial [Lachnospiraceae bacterium]|nr:ATP-binding protein [Lachnospiraceae bacterium]